MNRLSIKINPREFFTFLLTLLSIWMSRTVFFGVINQNTMRLVYLGCILLAFLFLRISVIRVKKTMSKAMVPFCLFALNLLWHFSEMNSNNKNAVVGYILMLLCGAMTVIFVDPQLFAKHYIRILSVYCLVSLPCVLTANLNQALAYTLCQSGYDWKSAYGYSPFYTWGMNGTISSRNAGPFWEPGAFQGYIWIAILLLLFNVDKQCIKRRKKVFILLFITLLTTQSTTAYVLLAIAFLCFNRRVLQLLEIKNMNTRVIVMILVLLVGMAFLSTSPVITNKIGNENNVSNQMRTTDILTGGLLALRSGPLGLGETSTRNSLRMSLGLYKDDSAGLIQITYTFGWFMGLYYIIALCGIARRLFDTDAPIERVGISVLMIIFHLTEGLWSLPLFWVLIFEHSEGIAE